MQESGTRTVRLEEIVRQRDPELKQVVEPLARGDVAEAIAGLERQSRVYEFKNREERIGAIVREVTREYAGRLARQPIPRRDQRTHPCRAAGEGRGGPGRAPHVVLVSC